MADTTNDDAPRDGVPSDGVPREVRERRSLGGPLTVAHADQFAAILSTWDGRLDVGHRDADVHLLHRVDWSDGFEEA